MTKEELLAVQFRPLKLIGHDGAKLVLINYDYSEERFEIHYPKPQGSVMGMKVQPLTRENIDRIRIGEAGVPTLDLSDGSF